MALPSFVKDFLNRSRRSRWYKALRRNRYAHLARSFLTYPDWQVLLKQDWPRWQQAVREANGPRVLIGTNLGLHSSAAILDSMFAIALTLRGARVEIALCDGALPACMMADHSHFGSLERFNRYGPSKELCQACQFSSHRMFGGLGLKINWLSQLAAQGKADALDPAVVEHAMAGSLRFYARESLYGEEQGGAPIHARYTEAAVKALSAARALFSATRFDAALFHHGIYVPQGLFTHAAREAGTRVVTWHTAYRERTAILSHGDTYHRTMLNEPHDSWENLSLTTAQREEILDYLHSRRSGKHDWVSYQRDHQEGFDAVSRALGLDPSRPYALLLTSVGWDARLHYHGCAYASQEDWMVDTIRYFAAHPELQLVIRIHPAEVLGSPQSRQHLADVVRQRLGTLPANVFLIEPTHKANTYALAERANAALVYSTKMGIEIASLGVPVIVAGEAWIRGKGFSLDASSAGGYLALLKSLPLRPMAAETQERAITYAYHFFLRRMIPLNAISPESRWPLCRLNVKSLDDLMPGRDKGLDIICEGILNGTPFIYPAEHSS